MEELLNLYINITYGYQIDTKERNKIKNIVGYLYDNNYTNKFIIEYLLKNGTVLIDDLWKDSLLKPNTFYYHNKLRITSNSPIWNVHIQEKTTKFYLEMIINFSIEDLLDYYYTKLSIPLEFRDTKRDAGAFKHMLNKKYINKVESVDFLLALIDYNKEMKNESIISPFDLKYQREVYNRFQYIIDNSKYNHIIWRDYNDE